MKKLASSSAREARMERITGNNGGVWKARMKYIVGGSGDVWRVRAGHITGDNRGVWKVALVALGVMVTAGAGLSGAIKVAAAGAEGNQGNFYEQYVRITRVNPVKNTISFVVDDLPEDPEMGFFEMTAVGTAENRDMTDYNGVSYEGIGDRHYLNNGGVGWWSPMSKMIVNKWYYEVGMTESGVEATFSASVGGVDLMTDNSSNAIWYTGMTESHGWSGGKIDYNSCVAATAYRYALAMVGDSDVLECVAEMDESGTAYHYQPYYNGVRLSAEVVSGGSGGDSGDVGGGSDGVDGAGGSGSSSSDSGSGFGSGGSGDGSGNESGVDSGSSVDSGRDGAIRDGRRVRMVTVTSQSSNRGSAVKNTETGAENSDSSADSEVDKDKQSNALSAKQKQGSASENFEKTGVETPELGGFNPLWMVLVGIGVIGVGALLILLARKGGDK